MFNTTTTTSSVSNGSSLYSLTNSIDAVDNQSAAPTAASTAAAAIAAAPAAALAAAIASTPAAILATALAATPVANPSAALAAIPAATLAAALAAAPTAARDYNHVIWITSCYNTLSITSFNEMTNAELYKVIYELRFKGATEELKKIQELKDNSGDVVPATKRIALANGIKLQHVTKVYLDEANRILQGIKTKYQINSDKFERYHSDNIGFLEKALRSQPEEEKKLIADRIIFLNSMKQSNALIIGNNKKVFDQKVIDLGKRYEGDHARSYEQTLKHYNSMVELIKQSNQQYAAVATKVTVSAAEARVRAAEARAVAAEARAVAAEARAVAAEVTARVAEAKAGSPSDRVNTLSSRINSTITNANIMPYLPLQPLRSQFPLQLRPLQPAVQPLQPAVQPLQPVVQPLQPQPPVQLAKSTKRKSASNAETPKKKHK